MSTKNKASRRGIKYMAIVVIGSLLLGMGVNLLLIYSGVVTGNSFETVATVRSCESNSRCEITYQHNGQSIDAVLRAPERRYEAGSTPTVRVYEGEPGEAYAKRVVPLGFALTVTVIGLMITVFGSIKLYKFWRTERTETVVLDEIDITDPPGPSDPSDDKDDK